MILVFEEEYELNNRVSSRFILEFKFDEDEGDIFSNYNSIIVLFFFKFRVRRGLVCYICFV